MKRAAVLVTGSREWSDYRAIRDRMKLYPAGTIVLHGAARGADSIAADLSREFGHNHWPLPYFGDLGKAGGHARNKCLLNLLCTLEGSGFDCSVEAFPMGDSPGTRGCIQTAKVMASTSFRRPLPIYVTEGKQ